MPDHCQTTAKEHFYEWYKHRNNQCYYNRLILENSILCLYQPHSYQQILENLLRKFPR